MTKLLTVHDVANTLAVAPKTIRKWIKAGKLAGIKLPSGEFRFKEEHIENWTAKRTIRAKAY